jgi:hypothetical protein
MGAGGPPRANNTYGLWLIGGGRDSADSLAEQLGTVGYNSSSGLPHGLLT